ncbi:MAG: carbon storage regulator CsrA [Armatimonadota bacterium]
MLVLARKVGQQIVIGEEIELTVLEVRGEQVRLGINAPRSISIHRKELLIQVADENVAATSVDKDSLTALADVIRVRQDQTLDVDQEDEAS